MDERDTLFARMERKAGTAAYRDYYARRPRLRAIDDRLRAMPPLLDPRGRHYDAEVAERTQAYFDAIEAIQPDPAVVRGWATRLSGAGDPTAVAKAMLLELGAVAAGGTRLDPAWVYTHKGRFDEDYGREVRLDHASALVFLVEMDHARMRQAPLAPALLESARQYYRAARIAKVAAAALEAAGHPAKPHYDAHYDVILPPLAVAAGLGELGRNNILVADRYGSRVRIGAVTTDMPLAHDAPTSLGVAPFCAVCGKCAANCPARALTRGPRVSVRGTWRWPTHVERCHGFWRQVGTDCGICMAVCPFSHPNRPLHNAVRGLLRRAPRLAALALRLDDLVYGPRWRPASSAPRTASSTAARSAKTAEGGTAAPSTSAAEVTPVRTR